MRLNLLPLRAQVLILLIGYSLLIILALSLLIVGQYFYLDSTIQDIIEKDFNSFYENQIGLLISERANTVEFYLKKQMSTAEVLSRLVTAVIKESPMVSDESKWTDDIATGTFLEYGVFHAPRGKTLISAKGDLLVNDIVVLDKLWKHFYRGSSKYYCGFSQAYDDILYFYPAAKIKNGIKPEEQTWYQTALSGEFSVSNPYISDISGEEVITVATQIQLNEEIIGVAAVDILKTTISELYEGYENSEDFNGNKDYEDFEDFEKQAFFAHSFELLMSLDGNLLGKTSKWEEIYPNVDYIQNSSFITWEEFMDLDNKTAISHQGEDYKCIKGSVTPFSDSTVSHYLLICSSLRILEVGKSNFEEDFRSVFKWALLAGLAVLIAFLLIILTVLWLLVGKTITRMRILQRLLRRFSENSHRPDMSYSIEMQELQPLRVNLRGFYFALREYWDDMRSREGKYQYFNWPVPKYEDCPRKPFDITFYNEWTKKVYPVNEKTKFS